MSSQSELCVLLSREEIAAAVTRLAAEIKRDYLNKRPLLIGILKGFFMFMADLVRRLDRPLEVEFVRLSRYGKGADSSGKVQVIQDLRSLVMGRDVLVIEGIYAVIKEIRRLQGGLVAAVDGRVLARLALPIVGLLSVHPVEIVADRLAELKKLVKDLGSTLASRFATLSIPALPVIPELRLTERGLVDVNTFELVR